MKGALFWHAEEINSEYKKRLLNFKKANWNFILINLHACDDGRLPTKYLVCLYVYPINSHTLVFV